MLINAPISRQAIDEMRIWARGSGSSPGQQNARTSFMSNSVDGGSGFDCGDYASWVDGMGCVHDEEIIVTPEEGWIDDPFFDPESLDEEDDSGGFYPPQPDDTECHVAYGGGGGVGPGPVPDPDACPIGQVKDANGNCIEGEVPCVGNPIKNPRIAPQEVSGVNGGQFGPTRSGGEQFHNGIDIENEIGSPFFAMHGGKVVSVGYEPEGIGYFVTIQSYINGEYYTHQYGHLQKDGRPANDTDVNAGTVIGVQGLSGNLEGAVISGITVPHTHIVIRKRIGSGWDLKNDYSAPENPKKIMTTQFDSQGNPLSTTDC